MIVALVAVPLAVSSQPTAHSWTVHSHSSWWQL
jgi:hypothetical protein